MSHLALIIGNGFDIDAGLPSKYSDFVKSSEWEDLCHRFGMFMHADGYEENSLVAHLQKVYGEKNWFDIEEEIYKFIQAHPNCDNRAIQDIRNEFNAIKKALVAYLKRVAQGVKAKDDKLSWKLMHTLEQCQMTKNFIYFNYTSCFPIAGPTYHLPEAAATFTDVHGSLRYGDIVLGCDLQPNDQVNRSLSFMYKYNMIKRSNYIAKNLSVANEIIFFGHSVNEMDFGYFRQFFQAASTSPDPIRHLTFITYDEESERSIKDNIRNQGINVTDLYSNLCTLKFFHVKKLYEGDPEEQSMWNHFLMRILSRTSPNNILSLQ